MSELWLGLPCVARNFFPDIYCFVLAQLLVEVSSQAELSIVVYPIPKYCFIPVVLGNPSFVTPSHGKATLCHSLLHLLVPT